MMPRIIPRTPTNIALDRASRGTYSKLFAAILYPSVLTGPPSIHPWHITSSSISIWCWAILRAPDIPSAAIQYLNVYSASSLFSGGCFSCRRFPGLSAGLWVFSPPLLPLLASATTTGNIRWSDLDVHRVSFSGCHIALRGTEKTFLQDY